MSRFFQDFSFFSPSGYGRTTVFGKDRILKVCNILTYNQIVL
ncbi:hypothetical protein LEP1GSC192_2194 [Leptospira sp. B5-022]|nr:hypothetical protein LEP1GSC192_2194 [Leptospira sp. B5-022]